MKRRIGKRRGALLQAFVLKVYRKSKAVTRGNANARDNSQSLEFDVHLENCITVLNALGS